MTKLMIKATGSTCYDKTGITFPNKISINWDNIMQDIPHTWENMYGWGNQPEVITFFSEHKTTVCDRLSSFADSLNGKWLYVIVTEA